MHRIQVSPKVYQSMKLGFAFSLGASLGTGLGWFLLDRQLKSLNEKIIARHTLLSDAYQQMEEIARDVSMSWEERQVKIDEIAEFVAMVSRQDLT